MKGQETPGQVDWISFKDNGEVKEKLKELVHEVHIASIQFAAMKREDVAAAIADYIASKGFPSRVAISVSEPNEANQRMVMGIAHSPITSEDISF